MFKDNIREVRKSRKLKLREVAGMINVPLSTWSKYEQGVIKPGVEILERIGKNLDVDLNWLITGQKSIDKKVIELMAEHITNLQKAYSYKKNQKTKEQNIKIYIQQAKELMKGKEWWKRHLKDRLTKRLNRLSITEFMDLINKCIMEEAKEVAEFNKKWDKENYKIIKLEKRNENV